MEETLNEIMASVAIHKKMVELRDRAKKEYESAVSCSVNDRLSYDPNTCKEQVIKLHKAYRIFMILNTLLERGPINDANNDLDRIYFDLSCQV